MCYSYKKNLELDTDKMTFELCGLKDQKQTPKQTLIAANKQKTSKSDEKMVLCLDGVKQVKRGKLEVAPRRKADVTSSHHNEDRLKTARRKTFLCPKV
jgi:hypothetical protein